MSAQKKSVHAVDPSPLYRCLEKKVEALKAFYGITESIQDRLNILDMAEVGRLLARRQELIHTIEAIDEEAQQIRSRIPLPGKNISADLREKIPLLSQTIGDLLGKVAELDQKCLALLTKEEKETKDQLLRIQSSSKVVHSYANFSSIRPRFMDVRK